MKKYLFLIVAALTMLACNAQESKNVSPEAQKFATEAKLTESQQKRFYDAVSTLNEMAAPLEAIVVKYRTAEDEPARQSAQAEYEKVYAQMMTYLKGVIKDNRDNAIPAFFAQTIAYELDFNEMEEFCAENTGYYNHPAMAQIKQMYEGLKKRAPGTTYSDLEANDLAGNPHKLSEYVGKGNYVLVDFWASWCGPCRQEMPNVKAAYDKYHAKGFEIVGLSFDNKHDAWQKAVNDMNLNWIHLSDLKGWQTIAHDVYGVNSIPASILVDPNGVIIAEGLRGEALGAKLAEIYGE